MCMRLTFYMCIRNIIFFVYYAHSSCNYILYNISCVIDDSTGTEIILSDNNVKH